MILNSLLEAIGSIQASAFQNDCSCFHEKHFYFNFQIYITVSISFVSCEADSVISGSQYFDLQIRITVAREIYSNNMFQRKVIYN